MTEQQKGACQAGLKVLPAVIEVAASLVTHRLPEIAEHVELVRAVQRGSLMDADVQPQWPSHCTLLTELVAAVDAEVLMELSEECLQIVADALCYQYVDSQFEDIGAHRIRCANSRADLPDTLRNLPAELITVMDYAMNAIYAEAIIYRQGVLDGEAK